MIQRETESSESMISWTLQFLHLHYCSMAQLYLSTALRPVKDHMEYSWAVFSLGHERGGALRQWSVILQWRNTWNTFLDACASADCSFNSKCWTASMLTLLRAEFSGSCPWLLTVITDVGDGLQSSTGTSHWRTMRALFYQWISQQLTDSRGSIESSVSGTD